MSKAKVKQVNPDDNPKTKKVTAKLITKHLARLHFGRTPHPHLFFPEVKTGPSWGQNESKLFIMDAVAIKTSWSDPLITAYEIKVSRSDFLRDKKWQNYQRYCHKFSFVCPVGLIKPEELPGDVGLIYYSVEHDEIFTKRRAMKRSIDMYCREVNDMMRYLVMYRCK